MTTEHRSVALSDARNRRKVWISAEIERCQLEAQDLAEVAARVAKGERQPER